MLDPAGTTCMLPATAYLDDAVLAWERTNLFAKAWVSAGRSSDLANVGARRAVAVGDDAVLLVRGDDRVLRGFYNVCQHRAHELAPCGSTSEHRSIHCPYHGWRYGLDGSLLSTPRFDAPDDFDRSRHPLVAVAVEEWHGWIMVNADGGAEPVGSFLRGIEPHVADHEPERLIVGATHRYELAANWKLVIENYQECFHCPNIHPELCAVSPSTSGENYLGHEGFWVGGWQALMPHAVTMSLNGASPIAPLRRLQGEARRRIEYIGVVPNMLVSLHPDYVMTHRLDPIAPGRTAVECQWLFAPEAVQDPGFDPSFAVDFWDLTNRQDWAACESVQRGLGSAATAKAPSPPRRTPSPSSSAWSPRPTGPAGGPAAELRRDPAGSPPWWPAQNRALVRRTSATLRLLTDASVRRSHMALVDTVRGGDLDTLDALIGREEATLVARTPRSHELHVEAAGHLPGGVASSWQDAPPCPVFIDRGLGSRVWDVDGTEYVDLHGGFGTMVAGHGHPAIVAAVTARVAAGTHFAQPVPDIIPVARELGRRFGLPMWRFTNSGTEATLAAVHVMRAATGRSHLIKVEGSYHGHHDTVQVSVHPDADDFGHPDHPTTVREHGAVPAEVAALVHVVPFGSVDAVRRVLLEHPGQIAGMIIEPVMMNIGVVAPPPGYLDGLATLLHTHGALLAFDEVKTGLTIAPGGATERFGVVPDIVCLAKALGGGIPCGAIGGTADVMDLITTGTYEQVGTFNGNPLTMAAAKTMLLDVLTPAAYAHFDELREDLSARALHVLARYRLPGYVSAFGAKGAVVFSPAPIRDYRDFCGYDARYGHAHWLYQHNGGVFLPPWGKMEQWTLSVQHGPDDVAIVAANLERFARDLHA